MPTSITSNPFPLGFISPAAPGTPAELTAVIPDFDCPYVNAIHIQAGPNNTGRVYFGNASLNVAINAGVIHFLSQPGDSLVLSNFAQNVYRLSDFRIDVQNPGDGAFVAVYVR